MSVYQHILYHVKLSLQLRDKAKSKASQIDGALRSAEWCPLSFFLSLSALIFVNLLLPEDHCLLQTEKKKKSKPSCCN